MAVLGLTPKMSEIRYFSRFFSRYSHPIRCENRGPHHFLSANTLSKPMDFAPRKVLEMTSAFLIVESTSFDRRLTSSRQTGKIEVIVGEDMADVKNPLSYIQLLGYNRGVDIKRFDNFTAALQYG